MRDLERSVAWYCRLLGARDVFRNRNDTRAFSASAILEPSSRTVLAFTQHDVLEGGAFTPRRVGLDHLSFAVPDRAALDAWQARLDELGIEHEALVSLAVRFDHTRLLDNVTLAAPATAARP